MAKTHRDNVKARKKRGEKAYKKRRERRRKPYIGPWEVTFSCGATEHFPMASSEEINSVAIKQHNCQREGCKAERFKRLA